MAVGLKDAGNVTVTRNRFVHDHTGLYIDQTPLQAGHTLAIADNLFARCDDAIRFHASGHRTAITGNDFLANATSVAIEGGGDAADVDWRGNYFDDYAGYDLDGDGTGDLAYQARSFAEDLTGKAPAIAFFHETPALAAADAVTRLVPMSERRTLLTDPTPRMRPHDHRGPHAGHEH